MAEEQSSFPHEIRETIEQSFWRLCAENGRLTMRLLLERVDRKFIERRVLELEAKISEINESYDLVPKRTKREEEA